MVFECKPLLKPGDLVKLKNFSNGVIFKVLYVLDGYSPICVCTREKESIVEYYSNDLELLESIPTMEEVASSLTKEELEVCFNLLSLCAGNNASYSAYTKLAALFDPDGTAEEPKGVKVFRRTRDGVVKKCKDVFIQIQEKQ